MLKTFKLFGAFGELCQNPRIRDGLLSLGLEESDNADLIYSNDPSGYESALIHKEKFGGKVIFNVLDCPSHLPEFYHIVQRLSGLLPLADRVTSISKYTQSEVKKWYNIDSEVIYNPIKPVSYQGIKTSERIRYFCAIGRLNDPNKRFNLIRESINPEFLDCFGDRTNWGNCFGTVSDETLNKVYNNTKTCLITSKIEGLNLVALESLICLCIPIICNDMTTSEELFPKEFLCEPTSEGIKDKIAEIFANQDYFQELLTPYAEEYKNKFDKKTIADNIVRVFNEI